MTNTRIANRRGVVPIGTIIAFYDFNAAFTFDAKTWAYCDGTVVTDVDSPLVGLTLPDLANRYLVGFGSTAVGAVTAATKMAPGLNYVTDDILTLTTGNGDARVRVTATGGGGTVTSVSLVAGGSGYAVGAGQATSGGSGTGCTIDVTAVAAVSDMGTAAWATAPVGQNGHAVNIRHLHLFDHNHSMYDHVHQPNGNYGHTAGTVSIVANTTARANAMTTTSGTDEANWNYRIKDDAAGWGNRSDGWHLVTGGGGTGEEGQHGHMISHTHATSYFTGHTSGPNTAYTTNAAGGSGGTSYTSRDASYNQNVQPQSIRVRWLIKIA